MALSHVNLSHQKHTPRAEATQGQNGVRSGIRTHAPEETGALNQRLRPLGHPNTTLCKSESVGVYREESYWTRTQKVVSRDGLEPPT